MKTAFKIIAGLLVVIVIAIAAALITFNPNDYKKQITQAVEQQTGRTLNIQGNISLSVFPWIGFEVGKISLSNAKGFSAKDFARISQLDIKIKLLPLLRREVEIDKVRLHGLFVSLEVHKDGKTNWQDLLPSESTEVDKQATLVKKKTNGESPAGPALAGLLINGIDFDGANIQWIDDRSGMEAKVSNLNLETGAIKFDDWIPISSNAHVSNSKPAVAADIKLTTRLKINQALDVFNVKSFTLSVNTLMKSIAPDPISSTIKMNADADMRNQEVKLSSLDVSALGADLHAVLTVTNLDTKPLISGVLNTNNVNPRKLAKKLGIDLPPASESWALGSVSLSANVKAGTTFAKLDKLVVKLDKSTLNGFIHVNNFTQPNIAYRLALDNINVDAYLPPPAPTAVAAPATAAPPADVPIKLPLPFLRKLALDGEFSIASLQVKKIMISDMLIKTHAADGVIKVDPLSMKLLNGDFIAGVTLDARSTPSYHITARATNITPGKVVNPMLVGLLGNQKLSLTGTAQFNSDIKTQGESLNALKKAATGVVALNMGQTSLNGVDLNNYFKDKLANFLTGKNITPPKSLDTTYTPQQKTAFDKVMVHANLGNGRVNNDRLLLDSNRIKVNGSGVIDIMNNTLDEKVFVRLDAGSQGSTAHEILKHPLGVRLHGPFAKLATDIDYSSLEHAITGMLKARAKAKLKEKADALKAQEQARLEAQKKKLQEQAAAKKAAEEQKAKDKLKNKLKGLFGR